MFDRDLSAFVVVCHYEVCLRMVHGAVVWPAQQTFGDACVGIQRGMCRRPRFEHLHAFGGRGNAHHAYHCHSDRAGQRAFLDHEAVADIRRVAVIDQAADRRPDRWNFTGLVRAPADAVDRLIGVVGEGEHIAIAGEVLAELRGHR
jgi:hypothetical protein